jgi:cytidine deaminase
MSTTPPGSKHAMPSDRELLDLARHAFASAHAPYSNFRVGAAVVDELGRVHTGCNVENVSYGLTMCAERSAIFTAIGAGARRICRVAVAAEQEHPVMPCGACRQVLVEFGAADTCVVGEDGNGAPVVWRLDALLPFAFASAALGRPTPS